MAIQSSSELQKLSLSAILTNHDLFNQVKIYITEGFFDVSSYKLIYKSLVYFNSKTNQCPNLEELILVIIELHNPAYGDLAEVKSIAQELFYYRISDLKFVVDKLSTFIKRSRVEGTLKDLLPRIQQGEDIAIEEVGMKIASSVDLSICSSKPYQLSDLTSLPQIRRDAVGTDSNPTVIRSCIPSINDSLTFKGYKPGDVIMFVSAPGSGKTMWMINECTNAAQQGYNAIHIFVGDMKEYDGFVRYASRVTGSLQDDIVAMSVEQQAELVQRSNYTGIFNRIINKSYPPGSVTARQVFADINQFQSDLGVHFDMIAIDYPDNLISESDMMYESGGDIYNQIASFGYTNQSVMLTGSQPKQAYWNDEIIPMNAAAESSKKQHVVDVVITAGKKFKGSKMISYHLAKVRRGNEGGIIRVKSSFERAYLEQCSDTEYLQYIADNYSPS